MEEKKEKPLRASTLRTREKMASALREMLAEQDYSKLTVAELTKRVGINRKTFYYHFRSLDDLLRWMVDVEIVQKAKQTLLKDGPRDEIITLIMNYIADNQVLMRAALKTVGQTQVRKFLYQQMHELASYTTEIFARELADEPLEPDYKAFIVELYTEAFAGAILNWVEHPERRTKDQISNYILRLIRAGRQLELK